MREISLHIRAIVKHNILLANLFKEEALQREEDFD